MEPGTSVFAKRMRYCNYDVTEALRPGPNAVGVSVGRGRIGHWWLTSGDHEFILQLEVHHTDGSIKRIVSDRETWKATARGPIIPLPPGKSDL
jgi:alpha-L-rhamnosidase